MAPIGIQNKELLAENKIKITFNGITFDSIYKDALVAARKYERSGISSTLPHQDFFKGVQWLLDYMVKTKLIKKT